MLLPTRGGVLHDNTKNGRVTDYARPNTLTNYVPKVININFLITISLHNKENKSGELMKKLPKRKCFELLSNSLNLFFMECIEISLENLYVDIGA